MGDKKSPFYRVIAADARAPRDGKFLEILGTYDPLKNPGELKLDVELVKKWLANGAQPTDTARALLEREGLIEKKAKPAKTSAVKKSKSE